MRENPLHGCIASLDGITIEVTNPPEAYVPRNLYFRMGMYAIPVQACVDSNYRFLYIASRCSGSTHDSIEFVVSRLSMCLHDVEMHERF